MVQREIGRELVTLSAISGAGLDGALAALIGPVQEARRARKNAAERRKDVSPPEHENDVSDGTGENRVGWSPV